MSADPKPSPLNPSVPAPAIERVCDLLEAARRHGLRLVTDQTELDRSGLDSVVVHARDEHGVPWIVRSPRRPDVVAGARVEARVLALVRPRLPVAVPHWRVHEPEVIAYPRLPGVPAVTVDPTTGPSWNILDPAAPNDAFLDSFAAALVALQAIPPEAARAAGVPVKTIAEVRAHLDAAMHATRELLSPSPEIWARWRRWIERDEMWPDAVALTHGDLHPGHMLLEADGRLVGILDWTEAAVTDPSMDLAMFFGCFGRPALEALLEKIARAGAPAWPGGRLVERAAERWAAFPVLGAEWSMRTGNTAALDFARAQLAAASAAS